MKVSEKAVEIMANCRFCFMCRHVCPIGNATGLERNTARARAFCGYLVAGGDVKAEEIVDNIYECALCGACTNNCITGWDPKVFVREIKTANVMNGLAPDYVMKMIEKYQATGSVYGETPRADVKELLVDKKADTLVLLGEDAVIKAPDSVIDVKNLLDRAKVDYTFGEVYDVGSSLYFLTGMTKETKDVAKKCADYVNGFKTVVVYDPTCLSMIKHEYREWGIEITADVKSFNEYLLELINSGAIKVNKTDVEYTLQDNFAYARELDDTNSGRELIERVGKNKDMLLIKKEANLAGHLVMNEYMPAVINAVAVNRWADAKSMDCKTLVAQSPAEYLALLGALPEGNKVLTIEQMILENLK